MCVVRRGGGGVFGECLGFFSRAPCPGAAWCSERMERFHGVFQVLGGFP
jgi:hypothetical protein